MISQLEEENDKLKAGISKSNLEIYKLSVLLRI